jgi:hypothetical protein
MLSRKLERACLVFPESLWLPSPEFLSLSLQPQLKYSTQLGSMRRSGATADSGRFSAPAKLN